MATFQDFVTQHVLWELLWRMLLNPCQSLFLSLWRCSNHHLIPSRSFPAAWFQCTSFELLLCAILLIWQSILSWKSDCLRSSSFRVEWNLFQALVVGFHEFHLTWRDSIFIIDNFLTRWGFDIIQTIKQHSIEFHTFHHSASPHFNFHHSVWAFNELFFLTF